MIVTVSLAAATICFLGQCHPALVGDQTPPGIYSLKPRRVLSPGYGGEVLKFDERPDAILSIHRLWLGRPAERREDRIASPSADDRRAVTRGCINVAPAVYDRLRACCSAATLVIQP